MCDKPDDDDDHTGMTHLLIHSILRKFTEKGQCCYKLTYVIAYYLGNFSLSFSFLGDSGKDKCRTHAHWCIG